MRLVIGEQAPSLSYGVPGCGLVSKNTIWSGQYLAVALH